jgi:predicted regulator of Ras-like GTPase activity (Roadblock/LC7/MglB family)
MRTPAQPDLQRWSEEVARDPRSLAFLPLARAYRRQGLAEAAMQLCLRGLETYPSHVEAHGLLALLYVEQGDSQKAADEWSIVLRLDPDNFEALRGLGFCFLEEDRLSKARQMLERAALLRPSDPAVQEAIRMLGTRQEITREGIGARPSPEEVAPWGSDAERASLDKAPRGSDEVSAGPFALDPAEFSAADFGGFDPPAAAAADVASDAPARTHTTTPADEAAGVSAAAPLDAAPAGATDAGQPGVPHEPVEEADRPMPFELVDMPWEEPSLPGPPGAEPPDVADAHGGAPGESAMYGAEVGDTGARGIPAPFIPPRATLTDPERLFDDLMAAGPVLAVLLVDVQGLVMAGRMDEAVAAESAVLGAVLSDAAGEAVRTVTHLALGDWRGVLMETEHALLQLAPVSGQGIVVVAARRATPPGWMRRAAARAADRAGKYLEAYE